MPRCKVCFRHCDIEEGKLGFCGARSCRDGKVVALNYGRLSAIALDPIEKKPLSRFFPGSKILSVGSYGCNLRCPFCQNYDISWSDETFDVTNGFLSESQDEADIMDNSAPEPDAAEAGGTVEPIETVTGREPSPKA